MLNAKSVHVRGGGAYLFSGVPQEGREKRSGLLHGLSALIDALRVEPHRWSEYAKRADNLAASIKDRARDSLGTRDEVSAADCIPGTSNLRQPSACSARMAFVALVFDYLVHFRIVDKCQHCQAACPAHEAPGMA